MIPVGKSTHLFVAAKCPAYADDGLPAGVAADVSYCACLQGEKRRVSDLASRSVMRVSRLVGARPDPVFSRIIS